MRVRLLQRWNGLPDPHEAGEVVDMPDSVADGFLTQGICEAVDDADLQASADADAGAPDDAAGADDASAESGDATAGADDTSSTKRKRRR